MISVVQLGRLDYATGLAVQQKLVDLRKSNQVPDVLLLLEHTPVITLGRNAKKENVLLSAEQLAAKGVEVFECDRGGDVTFHGPGQLVGYPIFDLRAFPAAEGQRKTLGAVDYIRRLEEVLIRTCLHFGIYAKRVPGLTGVWTDAGSSRPEAKIAALGVHISRAVTSHGFALNVNTSLDYFDLIVPCGILAKPVTSMARELGRELALDEVAQAVARNFAGVFNRQVLWVDTLDALLGRTLGIPMKPPAELRALHEEGTHSA